MARSNFFNVAATAVIIDGRSGVDFADEFAFRITLPEDLSEVVIGVDKASTSINKNTTAELEVSYKSTSETNDQILQLYDNQLAGFGRLISITINTGVNEKLQLTNCALKKAADIEGSNTMSMRSYMFTVEQFQRDTSA